ncbi:neuroligin-2-like [Liolophura sinensis]|uniref:neuroligin-2-like n=1 Tax=Liolophura sinensis TaxID=3198878 RepID=UPI0031585643
MRWLALAVVCLVTEQSARAGLVDYVIKNTAYGELRGHTQEIFPRRPVDIFLGVPYAKPPVDELRFEPPESPERWEGVWNATEMPPACPQLKSDLSYIRAHVPNFNNTSEDCLYLNIYAPYRRRNAASMPVLVYIHGGSNEYGMGGMFHGTVLASWTDVVVVTLNYRLGPLGFLSLGNDDMPGNYGLLDQLAALKWVKDNIHTFGGDPTRVTLTGHSSGSCDVSLHMVSPLAKGLFRSVITLSGSMTAVWAIMRKPSKPEPYARKMGEGLGCVEKDSFVFKSCLKNKTVDELVEAKIDRPPGLFRYYPVMDGQYMPALPEKLVDNGAMNARTYFTGVTKDEGALSARTILDHRGTGNLTPKFLRSVLQENVHNFPNVTGIVDLMMYEYTNWRNISDSNATLQLISELFGDVTYVAPMIKTADILSQKNVSVYVYTFEHRSKEHPLDKWLGVPHGDDLFYVFGAPLVGHKLYNYTDEDKRVSEMIMTIWGNYVKHGVPAQDTRMAGEKGKLKAYSYPSKLYTKFISEEGLATSKTAGNMRARKMAFWNALLPNLKRATIGHTSPLTTTRLHGLDFELLTWILVAVSSALFILLLIMILYVMRLRNTLTKANKPSAFPENN